MTPRETTALDRFRNRVEAGKETQRAIGESMGLSPTVTSSLIAGLNALNFKITTQKPGRKASATKAKATTKAVIAAKATGKRTNGAHAR